MYDYLYKFSTKEECDRFCDYLEDQKFWRIRKSETEVVVVSIFDETASELYEIADTI